MSLQHNLQGKAATVKGSVKVLGYWLLPPQPLMPQSPNTSSKPNERSLTMEALHYSCTLKPVITDKYGMLIHLYGAENWVLTNQLVAKLESMLIKESETYHSLLQLRHHSLLYAGPQLVLL